MGIYESVPASPQEVEAFGASLTREYLHCRVWGHDPEPHNTVLVTDDEVQGAFWHAQARCSHGCGVKWNIWATAEGDVVRRSLDYEDAEGYLSPDGRIDATGRSVLRK